MSERKVLNKYYPPDFDPSKIPRMKLPKNRKFSVRLMAPCNMRCTTCGEYIYKGKKFNARKEDVENEDYLGIRIYRFYIKCTRCLSEIAFKTDPRNTDYVIEAGATRNFQALKLAEEAAEREEQERIEEEKSNPMKLLENRTKASKHEMEMLESLEELKELNQRQATINYEDMLEKYKDSLEKRRIAMEEEEDERFIQSVFGKGKEMVALRLPSDDDSDEEPPKKYLSVDLTSSSSKPKEETKGKEIPVWNKSVGKLNANLNGLVKAKSTPKQEVSSLGIKLVDNVKSNTDMKSSSTALSLLSNYSDSE